MIYDKPVGFRSVYFFDHVVGIDIRVSRFQDEQIGVRIKEYLRIVGHTRLQVAGKEQSLSFRFYQEGVRTEHMLDRDSGDFQVVVFKNNTLAIFFIDRSVRRVH